MKKWALVTGAASGIGFEFARLLTLDHYNLVLIDVDMEALMQKREQLRAVGENEIVPIVIDLSTNSSASEVFRKIEDLQIEIDVLINNAGYGMFGCFSKTSWEREEKMINLHVTTPTQMVKLFLPKMIARRSGKILNVSSMAAFFPGPYMSIYYSTKAYLLSFTASVATELRDSGVTMTVLCPGVTRTGFQKSVNAETPKLTKMMADPGLVAGYGYRAMMNGKMLATPGLLNQLILVLRRFLPLTAIAKSVCYIQEKNRRKMSL